MLKRRLLTLPVALLTLALLGGAEGIDPDELACEQAVKHLIDCCPPLAPATQLECYTDRYCGSSTPDLSSAQSASIVGSSCDALAESNACNLKHPTQPPAGGGLPK